MILCWTFIATELIEFEAACNYFKGMVNPAHLATDGTPSKALTVFAVKAKSTARNWEVQSKAFWERSHSS